MTSPLIAPYPIPHPDPHPCSEVDLVRDAKRGDREAFNRLVLAYQDVIFNLAVRTLGCEDLADDITQITFLTAYAQLPRFRDGSFRGWLYRIATNACYDEFRRHKRHPVLSIDGHDLADEHMSSLYEPPSPGASPEMQAELEERAQLVQSALSQLDADQRMVVILVDLQEFDYREAALVLKIPVGTVKSRLSRARAHLQAILSKYGKSGLIELNN